MPGFNGTGPMGAGPMTGGGRGNCNPANTGYGRQYLPATGFGRGMGSGYGFRGNFGMGMRRRIGGGLAPNMSVGVENSVADLNMLKAEAAAAKNALETISRKIEELESL